MIHPELVKIALSRASGADFENFVNAFYSAIAGASFVPLGGNKDGGVDATEDPIYESTTGRLFYQASIERSPESKIRKTAIRIREFGRNPRTLVYVTSHIVKHIDQIEERLGDELDLSIRIRDGAYIQNHINESAATRAAFDFHLRHLTEYLSNVGASRIIPRSKYVQSPAVYVFLSQEVARRSGDVSLVNAIAESLALWALEGTDPAKGIYRTSDEVLDRICEELPSVRSLLQPIIQTRLEYLSRKKEDGSRDVRWYQKENYFCLPFETRRRIEAENVADESLRLAVLTDFEERIRTSENGVRVDDEVELASQVMLRSIQLAFEREGLEFGKYLEDSEAGEYPTISESVRDAIQAFDMQGKKAIRVASSVLMAIRGVLYSSTEHERQYLAKLSRTYALLFTLNTDPHLINFFQDLAGDLRLYVGTDILVRALSENFLAEPDRMTRTALRMAASLGATLVLTEPVLDEVVHNLRGADLEYRNNYQAIDAHVDFYMAQNIPKIMLRAYFYSRIEGSSSARRPRNWEAFVNSFCDHKDLHHSIAFQEMRRYLQNEYHLDFESESKLRSLVDDDDLAKLTGRLLDLKGGKYELAQNDALLTLSVYGRRSLNEEASDRSEFGYKTWWLTSETAISRHTGEIVRRNSGARYIMRPDFLLNFLALAPSAEQARATFASVFPSMMGIRLSKRMREDTFQEIMDQVRVATELSDGRRTAAIAQLSDKLKGDLFKQYPYNVTGVSG